MDVPVSVLPYVEAYYYIQLQEAYYIGTYQHKNLTNWCDTWFILAYTVYTN